MPQRATEKLGKEKKKVSNDQTSKNVVSVASLCDTPAASRVTALPSPSESACTECG